MIISCSLFGIVYTYWILVVQDIVYFVQVRTVNNHASQVIYCKHSDLLMIEGDITFELCMAINTIFTGQVLCAQKLKAVFVVVKLKQGKVHFVLVS